MSKSGKFSWFTLAGLAVVGTMAYMFVAPKLLPNKAVAAAPPTATESVGVLPQQLPNNMTMPAKTADIDLNFAGVSFAENVPGMSYGFPLAGV